MEQSRQAAATRSNCRRCGGGLDIAREEWIACDDCSSRHHASCLGEGARCSECGGAALIGPLAPLDEAHLHPDRTLFTWKRPAPKKKPIRPVFAIAGVLALATAIFVGREKPTCETPLPRQAPFVTHVTPIEVDAPVEVRPVAVRDLDADGDPLDARAWLDSSRRKCARGDYDGAAIDATRAIELDPRLSSAWFQRGMVRAWTDDVEGAVSDDTRAIEMEPSSEAAWNNRGYSRGLRGDYHASIADCTRAIELDANDAFAWNNRGWAKLQLGDLAGAEADIQRSLDINQTNSYAYENRAWLRLWRGDAKGAKRDLDRATDFEPRRHGQPAIQKLEGLKARVTLALAPR